MSINLGVTLFSFIDAQVRTENGTICYPVGVSSPLRAVGKYSLETFNPT